ncbi:MAG: hypothetical protein FWC42_04575 [Proteobacteria bacterium]|nr:hypothetical protein [Pseudomonadota bacterium]
MKRQIFWIVFSSLALLLSGAVWADNHDPVLPGPKLRGQAEGLGMGSLITTAVLATPKKKDVNGNDIPGTGGDVVVWGFRGSGQSGNYDYNGGTDVVDATLNDTIPRLESVGAFSKDTSHPLYSQKVIRLYTTAYTLSALTEEGELWTWGNTDYGTSGCWGNTSSKYQGSTQARQGRPCPAFGPITGEGIKKKVAFTSGGEYNMIAITDGGEVYSWGWNNFGQITNLGASVSQRTPVNITKFFGGEQVILAGGAYESQYAVSVDKNGKYTLWGWGRNFACGLAGATSASSTNIPVRMHAYDNYAKDIVYVNGGYAWTVVLLSDGRVLTNGMTRHLGIGNGSSTSGVCAPQLIMGPGTKYPAVTKLQARYAGAVAYSPDDPQAIYTWGWTGGSAFDQTYGPYPTRHQTTGIVKSIGSSKETVYYLTEDSKLYGFGYTSIHTLNLCSDSITSWDVAAGIYRTNSSMEWYTKNRNSAVPVPGGRRIPYEDWTDVVASKATGRTYPSWVTLAKEPHCSGNISSGDYAGRPRSTFRPWTPYDDNRDGLGSP